MNRNHVVFARVGSNPVAHDPNIEVLNEDHYIETYVCFANTTPF